MLHPAVMFTAILLLSSCSEARLVSDEKSQNVQVCRDLSAGHFCFPEREVYSAGDEGFLLELDSGPLAGSCNPRPEIGSITRVLFGDYRMPTPIPDYGGARNSWHEVEKRDRFFATASRELHEYAQAPGQPERKTIRAILDDGLHVNYSFYSDCDREARDFAKHISNLIEDARANKR